MSCLNALHSQIPKFLDKIITLIALYPILLKLSTSNTYKIYDFFVFLMGFEETQKPSSYELEKKKRQITLTSRLKLYGTKPYTAILEVLDSSLAV